MATLLAEPTTESPEFVVGDLITEDDEPVDNLPSAKNQRLLVEPLYNSPLLPRPFLADSNVGIFMSRHRSPIVPDMFLSLDVEIAEDWWAKEHRSYFIWEFGKSPEVVVEIVSNAKGGELGTKMQDYAHLGIQYYVVFDPQGLIQQQELQIYELHVGRYLPRSDSRLPELALSFMVWDGVFEDKRDRWLRWCNLSGDLLLTGTESAEQERGRAEQEFIRAEQESIRAEQERTRAEQAENRAEQAESRAAQLAAKLRELGIDPEAV